MRIAKTILVILIGVSIAMLPAATSFAAGAPSTTAASVPDCNHHKDAPADKTQKSDSDCISMAACVFHCFSLTGVAAAAVAFVPVIGATLQPLRASNHLSPQLGSLPFRPPRA